VSLQESAKRAVRPLKQKKDPVSIEMLLERIIIRFCSIVTSRVNNVT
jgi:hypothetical protein